MNGDTVTPEEARALLAAYPGDEACVVGYRTRPNGAEPTVTLCGEELRSMMDNGVPLWETAPAGEAAMRSAAPRMAATIARGAPDFSMAPIDALTPDDVRSLYPLWDETGSTTTAEPGAMVLCAFDVMGFGTPMRALWVRVVEGKVVPILDEDRTFWESTERVGLLGPYGAVAWPLRTVVNNPPAPPVE